MENALAKLPNQALCLRPTQLTLHCYHSALVHPFTSAPGTPDSKNVLARTRTDLQYDGLRAFAARAGLEVIWDYCDVGVSGRREGRPQLNALMAAARRREIDCVLVWKFDRFARSTSHLLMALEEFNYLGVRFISVQDQIDTDSSMGEPCSRLSAQWPSLSPHSSASG